MKILLTGGAGYVGSACLRWLLANGHDPIAFDNMSEGNTAAVPDGRARLVVGDIADHKPGVGIGYRGGVSLGHVVVCDRVVSIGEQPA